MRHALPMWSAPLWLARLRSTWVSSQHADSIALRRGTKPFLPVSVMVKTDAGRIHGTRACYQGHIFGGGKHDSLCHGITEFGGALRRGVARVAPVGRTAW